MPEVLKRFRDKYTKAEYRRGQEYIGSQVRLQELSELGYIAKPGEGDAPKHVGGGWYQLPNGEKVHGKEAALKALRGNSNA